MHAIVFRQTQGSEAFLILAKCHNLKPTLTMTMVNGGYFPKTGQSQLVNSKKIKITFQEKEKKKKVVRNASGQIVLRTNPESRSHLINLC